MSSVVKDKLLQKIKEKIRRKEDAKVRAAERNTVNGFVLEFIKKIESVESLSEKQSDQALFVFYATTCLVNQLKTIDSQVKVDILWQEQMQVSGVLIKWSTKYQQTNDCESELFVDVISLMFK